MIKPNALCPDLKLPLVEGGDWELKDQNPEHFTMMIFYRGLHCPVCKKYLEALEKKLSDFKDRGVDVVAISMDTEKRAKISTEKWDIKNVPVAYSMTEAIARDWGLYISKAIKDEEPEVFSEPALFLVRPDKTLYSASIQTMPFARPQFDDLLKSIDFINEKNYPARGGK
ncbi:peroxiredoxin-like family protein [Constantimarinum furrinae]|uniref:Alkyl hydroperoxide reductase n=1 Tax=Constantimarinum furrinae TaxID=2562285 RepID=A0A7G8PTZ7_9FLAO|nr:peroxiredoxin-like family protein [Constantimarinum furrinae]QNJ97813.1 alkyl hydroperoxide reductase [Constantimarinum furrinae]